MSIAKQSDEEQVNHIALTDNHSFHVISYGLTQRLYFTYSESNSLISHEHYLQLLDIHYMIRPLTHPRDYWPSSLSDQVFRLLSSPLYFLYSCCFTITS